MNYQSSCKKWSKFEWPDLVKMVFVYFLKILEIKKVAELLTLIKV